MIKNCIQWCLFLVIFSDLKQKSVLHTLQVVLSAAVEQVNQV
jgi:hypothetical protein